MTLPLIMAQLRQTGVALVVPLTAGAVGAASGRWAAAAWSPSQAVLLVMGLEQVLVLCSGAALAAVLDRLTDDCVVLVKGSYNSYSWQVADGLLEEATTR